MLFYIRNRKRSETIRWEKGDKVDIIGPLGNCWKIPAKKDALLIGGGVGIAPILNLFNSINTNINIDLFIGARYGKEHFLNHNPEGGIYLSTDNGEIGIKGNLFDAINKVFSIEEMQNKTIYVCGPPILMERIRDFSVKNSIECHLALETIQNQRSWLDFPRGLFLRCVLPACPRLLLQVLQQEFLLQAEL